MTGYNNFQQNDWQACHHCHRVRFLQLGKQDGALQGVWKLPQFLTDGNLCIKKEGYTAIKKQMFCKIKSE